MKITPIKIISSKKCIVRLSDIVFESGGEVIEFVRKLKIKKDETL